MTSLLVSDLPADMTLEMPCNNLLRTDMRTASMASLLGNGGKIWQTLFVDSQNFAASGADGSLMKPFQTLQQAINYAVAQTWTAVELLIAPATYAAAVAVPADLAVTFQGWDNCQQAGQVLLGGSFTVVGGVGSNGVIGFSNVVITAATISTVNPANQDMWVSLNNTYCSADIIGFNLTIEAKQSTIGGNVTPGGGCTFRWDGASWAYSLQIPLAIPLGANHLFFDAGHDTYARTLVANGVPIFPTIGSTVFVAMAVPTYVGIGDRVSIQLLDPAVQDFCCGVHGVGVAGTVTVWLNNLSRDSGAGTGNFNEDILLLVHHEQMVAEPAP